MKYVLVLEIQKEQAKSYKARGKFDSDIIYTNIAMNKKT